MNETIASLQANVNKATEDVHRAEQGVISAQKNLKAKKEIQHKAVQALVERTAGEAGFKLKELIRKPVVVKKKPNSYKLTPKYRNPNNPKETWGGQGRQPLWLVKSMADGTPREAFRVRED